MRLRRLRDEWGPRLHVEERAFALRPRPDPSVRFKGTYREAGWQRCAHMAAPDGIRFTPWPHERFPAWSLPALEAAKCVARQGDDLQQRLHLALYEAFFRDSRDIADPDELVRIVGDIGADVPRFVADRDAGVGRTAVAKDLEAAAEDGVRAIPTVIVPRTGECLVGLADLAQYRTAVEQAAA